MRRVSANAVTIDSAMIGHNIAYNTIAENIDGGGMGEVYGATDTNLKRQEALKVLAEGYSSAARRTR